MSDEIPTPQWKIRADIFGARHVYNADGEQLTNDRMDRTEGWDQTLYSGS